MAKKIGVIGSGVVGQVLANGFAKHGYSVMIETNNPAKHVELRQKTCGTVEIGTSGASRASSATSGPMRSSSSGSGRA